MMTKSATMDRASEVRLQTGFPSDASRWMLILNFMALSSMLLWRHWLGARTVGVFRIAGHAIVLLLWSFLVSLLIADGDKDRFVLLLSSGVGMTLAIALTGVTRRLVRWIKLQRGEQLHTHSLGLSVFSLGRYPNANAERYIDPLLTVAVGSVLCLPSLVPDGVVVGSWLVASGLALAFVEIYIQGLQLNRSDAMLTSEAHEQMTAAYLKSMTGDKRPVAARPVSTGVAPDIAASVARRQQRGPIAVAVPSAQLALPDAPTLEAAAGNAPEPIAILPTDKLADWERQEPHWQEATETSLAVHPLGKPLDAGRRAPARPFAAPRPYGLLLRDAIVVAIVLWVSAAAYLLFAYRGNADSAGPVRGDAQQSEAEEQTGAAFPARGPSGDAPDMAQTLDRADGYYHGAPGMPMDRAEAARLYRLAADQGSPRAQYWLGVMYGVGEGGLQQDYRQAAEWYRKAIDGGEWDAAYRLAALYLTGEEGLARNVDEAVRLWRAAADAGNANSQAALGVLSESGLVGVPKSESDAARWYGKAAEQGNSIAQVHLARMYIEARGGLAENRPLATRLLRSAADQGDRDGQTQLAEMYLKGDGGLPRSDKDAAKWFMRAAEQNEPWAEFRLGSMYELDAGGLPRDPVLAVHWFSKAAEQGVAMAQLSLAGYYESGRGGLPKSHAKAVEWYDKATTNSDPN